MGNKAVRAKCYHCGDIVRPVRRKKNPERAFGKTAIFRLECDGCGESTAWYESVALAREAWGLKSRSTDVYEKPVEKGCSAMRRKTQEPKTCASCAWSRAETTGRRICGLMPPTVVATHDMVHSAQPVVMDSQPMCSLGKELTR